MKTVVRIAASFVAAVLAAAPAAAQEPEQLDRIAAIVGDSMVLASEVQEEMIAWVSAQQQQLPQDPAQLAALQDRILRSKIDELLIVQAALQDSTIRIEARQVETLVQREIQRVESALGGRIALDRALEADGITLAEYRDILARRFRRQGYIEQYVQRIRQNRAAPTITDDEVRAFFEQNRAQFANRPASVTFRQIVVSPQASDTARARALATAQEVLELARGGEDFEQLARRFSDDPSAQQGGDLGWFRRGDMVQAFENAVYSLRPGQISGVVESPFGFHVIKLERIRGGERSARHVLIRADITDQDIERASAIADSLAAGLRAGTLDWDSVEARHHDESEQRRVGPFPVDQLPEPYASSLPQATSGSVLDPMRLEGGDGRPRFAIINVTDIQAAGAYDLSDPIFRSQLRDQLQQQQLLQEVVEDLRARTFVDIRI
ncbi:MAG TPA: peptidylprolyl isomerase [Longimicrobiales bacterium]